MSQSALTSLARSQRRIRTVSYVVSFVLVVDAWAAVKVLPFWFGYVLIVIGAFGGLFLGALLIQYIENRNVIAYYERTGR